MKVEKLSTPPPTPKVGDIIQTVRVPDTPGYRTPCLSIPLSDGRLSLSIVVDKDIADRIKRRAGSMDLDRYIWENIIHRALVDHVY